MGDAIVLDGAQEPLEVEARHGHTGDPVPEGKVHEDLQAEDVKEG